MSSAERHRVDTAIRAHFDHVTADAIRPGEVEAFAAWLATIPSRPVTNPAPRHP